MKKNDSLIILLMLGIFSCSLQLPTVTISSGLDQETQDKLSNQVGIVWENPTLINITQSIPGNWDSSQIADPKVIKIDLTYHMWYSGLGPDNVWRIGYASSTDGINWQKDYINSPVIQPNKSAKEARGVRVNSVMYDKDDDYFKMWYRGFGTPDEDGTTDSSCHLFFARSKYPNYQFIKYPNIDASSNTAIPQPIFTFARQGVKTNNNWIGSSSVLKESYYVNAIKYDAFILWHCVNLNGDNFNQPIPVIRTNFSINETRWTNDIAYEIFLKGTYTQLFYNKGFMMPTVIKDYYENTQIYKMWFLSNTPECKAGYSYSYDAKLFNYYNIIDTPIFNSKSINLLPKKDITNISDPWVIRDNNSYKMWCVITDVTGSYILYQESLNH